MSQPLRVLIVGDADADAQRLVEELRHGGFEPLYERVETASAMRAEIERRRWDLVIADHAAARVDSYAALRVLAESGFDIPFIIVSGSSGEEMAVEAIKSGANDYIMKDRLRRLAPAVARELESARNRRGHRKAQQALQQHEEHSAIRLAAAYDATLEGWARALDLRDHETEGHSRRVTELTLRLARHMGIKEQNLVHVRRGALLHDIGKMGIPDRILLKASALTPAEWEIMRKHPSYAYELLAPIAYLGPALDIPYCHHEKWDGSGYPRGLSGSEIPLAARIFAVADIWDAMTSDRPYRRGSTPAQVLEHIGSIGGTHLDPDVVAAFVQLMSESPATEAASVAPTAVARQAGDTNALEDSANPVILVVDDEETMRKVTRRILEGAGYQVLTAANGREGIAMLEGIRRVDCLVTDINMPDLSGDEMVRAVRGVHPQLKVLYVSGHVEQLFADRRLEWGDEAFLDKPFTKARLLEAVSLLLYGTIARPR